MNTTLAQRQDRNALEAELRAAGAEIRGNSLKCPFHDDRHPSASIYCDADGVWRFKCQAAKCAFGGDVFDVRARATGRRVEDVLREEKPKTDQRRPQRREKVFATLDELRGAIRTTGPVEGEYHYDHPETGGTEMVVFRLRTVDGKTFRQASPKADKWVLRAPEKPWPLYNRVGIEAADEVFLVEREKCVEAMGSIGITNATTTPCGAGKAEHCDLTPLAGKRIYLWSDNDPTGRNHMRQVMGILEKLTPTCDVRVIEPTDVDLNQKGDDVADLIAMCQKVGYDPAEEIDRACASAKTFTLSSGLRDRIENTINGKWADVAWPWPRLTNLSRALLPQTVTILCGTPGAAKSFLVFKALVSWMDANIPWACLALEEDRTYHLNRVLAIREENVELLDPEWTKEHPDETRAAYERQRDYLDRFGRRVWDAPVEAMTLGAVTEWIRQRASEDNRIIVVDPVTAATAEEKTWVADGKFVNAVKAIVRSHDTSLVLVTHPKKGGRTVGLDDLAGGAAYQRLTQTILWLERHKRPKKVTVKGDCGRFETEVDDTLHVCKARNGRGHGLALGFKIDWQSLIFSEQGIIVKEGKNNE